MSDSTAMSRVIPWLKLAFFRGLSSWYKFAFRNREGLADYDFTLQPAGSHVPGFSAMLRIKNEASKIESCLQSIADLFDEIVVVDNGSTDDTRSIIDRVAARYPNIRVYAYPHAISRCGAENEETPEDSVHSLAYYYNWCLSKCNRRWVFKWDGDMLLPRRSRAAARRILQEAQLGGLVLWNIKGQTVYVAPDGAAWASIEEINHEEMCFPNNPLIRYRKEKLWERLKAPFWLPEAYPDDLFFYEVKDTREDEFQHWTDTSQLSPRKRKEFENYHLVQRTSPPPADRFARIELA